MESGLKKQAKTGGTEELTNSVRVKLLTVPGPSTVPPCDTLDKCLWDEEEKGKLRQRARRKKVPAGMQLLPLLGPSSQKGHSGPATH